MRRLVAVTFAVALVGALPSALASWSAYGDVEPSTRYDREPGFMFTEPPTSGKKVFFNGFLAESTTDQNPNVATLRTNVYSTGTYTGYAMLGVWTDCNGDGYVGIAETAMREYPSELLDGAGAQTCPPSASNQNRWNGAHNYNGWVSELVPIGNDAVDITRNARQFGHAEVMVWSDVGKPDEPPAGGSCPITPLPRGTLATTGGLLNFAACRADVYGGANVLLADEVRLLGQPLPGAGDPLGLRFNDTQSAHGHAFWDRPVFGSEDSSRSAVGLADCDADPAFDSGEFLNATAREASRPATQNVTIHQPSPSVHDPADATLPGTANRTFSDLGDCDPSDTEEGPFYGPVEGDSAPVRTQGKSAANANFGYSQRTRGEITVVKPGWNGYAGALLVGGRAYTNPTPEWSSNSVLVASRPNSVQTRGSLAEGDLSPELAPANHITFYAFLPAALTDVLQAPGPGARYGAAQCGANTDGIHNGWNCDRDAWNRDTQGNPVSTSRRLAAPGDPYILRDVDCFDGGNRLGIGVHPAFYGSGSCEEG